MTSTDTKYNISISSSENPSKFVDLQVDASEMNSSLYDNYIDIALSILKHGK